MTQCIWKPTVNKSQRLTLVAVSEIYKLSLQTNLRNVSLLLKSVEYHPQLNGLLQQLLLIKWVHCFNWQTFTAWAITEKHKTASTVVFQVAVGWNSQQKLQTLANRNNATWQPSRVWPKFGFGFGYGAKTDLTYSFGLFSAKAEKN